MKNIFIFLLLVNIIYAQDYTVECPNSITFPNINSSTFYSYGFEAPDGNLLYGEMNTAENYYYFFDSNSPVCGGSSTSNILYEAYCDMNNYEDDTCFEVKLGSNGLNIVESPNNDGYTNGVTVVNGYPCMSDTVRSFTFGSYNWNDGSEIGLAYANIDTFSIYAVDGVDEATAKTQREICNPSNEDGTDYTALLTAIKDNTGKTSTNTDLTDVSNTFNIDDYTNADNEKIEFTQTFQDTFTTTFDKYSDVFGFGGYAPKPENITFSFHNQTYTIINFDYLDTHIEDIRMVILAFAYIWGFLIIFRGV